MTRAHDIVIFGATGFTGSLVAEYFAKNVPRERVRWALGGRNEEKLRAVRERLTAINPNTKDVPILLANTDERNSIRSLCANARVVLTTVGPFVRYGEPLFAACAEAGTDYIDSTGEPAFVRRMIERYDAQANKTGAIMVPCCGLDSIPTDLGVYFTMRELKPTGRVELTGAFSAQGKPSGGTWHSLLEAMGDLRSAMAPEPRETPTDNRRVSRLPVSIKRANGGYMVPLPTIDPEIALRSARGLSLYGPDFNYAHYLWLPKLTQVVGLGAGVAAVIALAQVPFTRSWLESKITPGEGPSEEERAKSWFKLRFTARHEGKKLVTEVRGGDPGYGETAKMLAESALSLFEDRAKLPRKSGVLTPALAMGDVLLERLSSAGIVFEVVS